MAICDNKTYFARDVTVYVKIGTEIWEIPVMDGFSFSQGNNTSEVVLSEMESSSGVSRRGKRMFNDSLAPVEWAFTTYVRPFASVGVTAYTGAAGAADTDVNIGNIHAVEEVMWALLAGKATRTGLGDNFHSGGTDYFTPVADTNVAIDFGTSDSSTLGTAQIFFTLESSGLTYEITGAAVNEATINFDIEGIAQIEWSGMGSTLVESTEPTPTIDEGVFDTSNFIRNRLTSMSVGPVKTGDDTGTYTLAQEGTMENSYALTLTGGSITISNNLTYITPEELGIVNVPIGHVTGTRSVSGSFTNYLVTDLTTDQSADFWSDIKALTGVVTHEFTLSFQVGGSAGTPRLELAMGHVHVEVPTHNIEDVIALETTFTALGSCINNTDELVATYVA